MYFHFTQQQNLCSHLTENVYIKHFEKD